MSYFNRHITGPYNLLQYITQPAEAFFVAQLNVSQKEIGESHACFMLVNFKKQPYRRNVGGFSPYVLGEFLYFGQRAITGAMIFNK